MDSDDVPGIGTSVDLQVSAKDGLVPQATGHLTCFRIWGATLFVDYYSNSVYIHPMKNTFQEPTLAANASYENISAAHGVKVKRYHADN